MAAVAPRFAPAAPMRWCTILLLMLQLISHQTAGASQENSTHDKSSDLSKDHGLRLTNRKLLSNCYNQLQWDPDFYPGSICRVLLSDKRWANLVQCTGTFIETDVVLTAASCFVPPGYPTYDNLDHARTNIVQCADEKGNAVAYKVLSALATKAWRQGIPAEHLESSNLGLLKVERIKSSVFGYLPNPPLTVSKFIRDSTTCTNRLWSFHGYPDRVGGSAGCASYDNAKKYSVSETTMISQGTLGYSQCIWSMQHIEKPLTLNMDSCQAMEGSPVFSHYNGLLSLIGIVSKVSPTCPLRSVEIATTSDWVDMLNLKTELGFIPRY